VASGRVASPVLPPPSESPLGAAAGMPL